MQVINKSLCTWWLQYRKLQVMFKVSPAILQIFTDTPNCVLEDHVQYSTVHIPNVFCDGHFRIINCVGIVRIHWVKCTEILWSPCKKRFQLPLLQHKFIRFKWCTFTNGNDHDPTRFPIIFISQPSLLLSLLQVVYCNTRGKTLPLRAE